MNIIDDSDNQYYSSEEENISDNSNEDISENDNSDNEISTIDKKKNIITLEDLQESYYYTVFWSAKEKEKLFKGIERYGKYNVDKIKKLLPNKSTIDIRMYISLLHKKYKYLKNNRSQELYSKEDIYNFYESGITESTEEEVKKEEIKAIQLIKDEQSQVNNKNDFGLKDYEMILRLFNVHLLLSLTTKLFIRKRDSGIHKDTLVYLYLQYIQWLRKVIKTVILVTEKRQLKKKKKSKCYISIEDLNETFYVMNFKNYQIDSPLSKLVFRRQGHFLLNALFRIKHNFNNFVHPDIKKSIIDEQTNTWARPYDVNPRFYRSSYNELLNKANSEEIKEYFKKRNNQKREIYNRYIKEHGIISIDKNDSKNNNTNNNEDNNNFDEIGNETELNNKNNGEFEKDDDDVNNNNNNNNNNDNNNNDSNNINSNNNNDDDDENINDANDNLDENYLKNDTTINGNTNINDNKSEDERIDNEDEEENDEIEEEEEEGDEDIFREDEIEDSISEDSTTDDNYYESNEEDNINKLINSNFITRRSNRRLSNSKRNREFESFESNKKRR